MSDTPNTPRSGTPSDMSGSSMNDDFKQNLEVDANAMNTDSLDSLQNADQRKIMDVVDKLRRTGLSGILQLPQLVVCGDQSSGKSSVLEAITEIPFPRKENLCTRFATEIVLRRDNTPSISTKILPDKSRPAYERTAIEQFSKSIQDFDELPSLIEEATKVMGLSESGGNARAFSRDVLSIEICGPKRPQLTVVDLPGLIHAKNKQQSQQDVELIKELVGEYIANERTIILAIISAKNDYANQIILERARQVDSEGHRTLGIITKPDFLREGSENEQSWIDLAMNRDIYFELGWHMLKNRGDDQAGTSFEERNAAERRFFSKGRYQELPQENVGIESLRVKLSQLLNSHLKKELPGLKDELECKLKETVDDLKKLGDKRTTPMEQRQFLMSISVEVHNIIKAAVSGTYEAPFFGAPDLKAPVSGGRNVRRLGAVVENQNLCFEKDMRSHGRKFAIQSSNDEDSDDEDSDDDNIHNEVENNSADAQYEGSDDEGGNDEESAETQRSRHLSRKEAVDWVLEVLRRSRGRELPGTFNPALIGQIFREQSAPWEGIARKHADTVADVCENFVRSLLQKVTLQEVQSRLFSVRIEPALRDSRSKAYEELDRIVEDNCRQPSTYNHYYTSTVQKMRRHKHEKLKKETAAECMEYSSVNNRTEINSDEFVKQFASKLELNMDQFSAEEALDCQIAYYKCARKYFVDVVARQVIERHLVSTLPDKVFSPNAVLELSDEEVKYIAGEPDEVTRKRKFLEARQKMLESGQRTFRLAMGALR